VRNQVYVNPFEAMEKREKRNNIIAFTVNVALVIIALVAFVAVELGMPSADPNEKAFTLLLAMLPLAAIGIFVLSNIK
jgi:membrane protease YdiL (CAAX protease family)